MPNYYIFISHCITSHDNESQPCWGSNTAQQHCWTTSLHLVSTTGRRSQYDCQDSTFCSKWNPCTKTEQIFDAHGRRDSTVSAVVTGQKRIKTSFVGSLSIVTKKDFRHEKFSFHKQIVHQQQRWDDELVLITDHLCTKYEAPSFIDSDTIKPSLCSQRSSLFPPIKMMIMARISPTMPTWYN